VNGYVIAGYVVVLSTLATYAVFLVARLRATRRRLGATLPGVDEPASDDTGALT
jgi:hypothetical protein